MYHLWSLMRGICLPNTSNSPQAFLRSDKLLLIKMLAASASDVDHVSKVPSSPYVTPLANMADKHLSSYSCVPRM